jgi:hypothetical protein
VSNQQARAVPAKLFRALTKSQTPAQDGSGSFMENVIEPKNVSLKEREKFSGVGGDGVEVEKFADEASRQYVPANFICSKPSTALNSVAKTLANALTPALRLCESACRRYRIRPTA